MVMNHKMTLKFKWLPGAAHPQLAFMNVVLCPTALLQNGLNHKLTLEIAWLPGTPLRPWTPPGGLQRPRTPSWLVCCCSLPELNPPWADFEGKGSVTDLTLPHSHPWMKPEQILDAFLSPIKGIFRA